MTVKKKAAPAPKQPVVTSKTEQSTKKAAAKAADKPNKKAIAAEEKHEADKTAPEPKKPEAKPKAKVKTPDQARADMLKPALDAKKKQDSVNRVAAIVADPLVVVNPKDAQIPVEAEPINRSIADVPAGLVEFKVEGSSHRLLMMEDSNATPTMAQRLAMAKRFLEVGPKLPKWVKTIEAKEPDFSNAEAEVKKAASAPAPKAAGEKKADKPSLANGVPLKKICADINIDPKLARRILRSKGKKPGGRWEWEAKDVDGIKKLIKEEAAKLEAE